MKNRIFLIILLVFCSNWNQAQTIADNIKDGVIERRLELNRGNVELIVSELDKVVPPCKKIVFSLFDKSYFVMCNNIDLSEFHVFIENNITKITSINPNSEENLKLLYGNKDESFHAYFNKDQYPSYTVYEISNPTALDGFPSYFALIGDGGKREAEIMLTTLTFPNPLPFKLQMYIVMSSGFYTPIELVKGYY